MGKRGRKPGDILFRFWEKVDKKGPDDCWLWQSYTMGGRKAGGEYGGFRLNEPRSIVYAHRFAFQAQNGYLPKVVRHSCDTPLCCNPAHLLPGTQADNVNDMIERRGPNRHSAKLTDDQVREVRRRLAARERHDDIAADFDVCRVTVTNINRGRSYASVS